MTGAFIVPCLCLVLSPFVKREATSDHKQRATGHLNALVVQNVAKASKAFAKANRVGPVSQLMATYL